MRLSLFTPYVAPNRKTPSGMENPFEGAMGASFMALDKYSKDLKRHANY